MALLLARVLAAGFVGVDAVDAPRELAARLAAEAAAPAGAEEAVAAASGGLGADIVIDAAGPPAALGAALELVRGRGTLSVVRAHFEPDHPLNNARMFEREITLRFSIGNPVRIASGSSA
jgi:alcohol dehydrogenase